MLPDPYAYYWYSTYGTAPHPSLSPVSVLEIVVACLLPIIVVAAVVGFEVRTTRTEQQPGPHRLGHRERRMLAQLGRDLATDDPDLAHMLETMTFDEGAHR
jgi:Protein of unknown function (DUF3040)